MPSFVQPAALASSCYLYQMLIDHTPATCDQDHIDIVISSRASTPDRTAFIMGKSKDDPFAVMEQDGFSLVHYGATVLAIPCNTAHYFYQDSQHLFLCFCLQRGTPLLIVHLQYIIRLTAQLCKGKGDGFREMKILVLNAKEVLHLFRIIFLPKVRCGSARI